MDENFSVVERFALSETNLMKDEIAYNIELVNCDTRIIVCYDPISGEYEHFNYDDIDLNTDEFYSSTKRISVTIREVYAVTFEVDASDENSAKEIAFTMYNDPQLDHNAVFEYTMHKSEWTTDIEDA